MEKEVWKDIEGYEGLYQVSNLGRVKSLCGWNGHKYLKREKILKKTLHYAKKGDNYKKEIVNLAKEKKRKMFKVHRLVAKAFVENPNNYTIINHIDNDPTNNIYSNLEWCTQLQNMNWCSKQFRNTSIKEKDEYKIIEMYKNGIDFKIIEKRFNIKSYSPIYRILKKHNVKRRNKYNIDKDKMLIDFKKKLKNKEIAKKYNCRNDLVASIKYQFKKKGMI